MSASRVRTHYEQLAKIAQNFGSESGKARATFQTLKGRMQSLEGGQWVSDAATKFYQEMNGSALPAIKRLGDSLEAAQKATAQISKLMKQAEDDAAAVLRGQGAGGGSSGSGGLLSSIGSALGKVGSALGSVAGFVGDLFVGAAHELVDMVSGIGHLILHPIDTLKGLAYGITHPKELWNAFSKPYVDDWNNGHPGRAIGRGLLFAASFLVGAGEAKTAASIGEAGEIAGKAGKLGELAGEVGKVGEVAGEAGKVAKVARWMEEMSESIKGTFATKPAQATGDAAELWRMAGEGQPALRTMTEDLAKLTGGKAEIAPLKDLASATEKVIGDYGGDFSQLRDVARSRVVYKSLDEAYKGLEALYKQGDMVFFKDRFISPTPGGFRDLLANVKLPNGHVAELRLSTEAMENISKLEHAATYEPIRSIERLASAEGRPLTAAENASIETMRNQFRPQYEAAWQELTQGMNQGSSLPGQLGQAGVAGKGLDTANKAYNDRED